MSSPQDERAPTGRPAAAIGSGQDFVTLTDRLATAYYDLIVACYRAGLRSIVPETDARTARAPAATDTGDRAATDRAAPSGTEAEPVAAEPVAAEPVEAEPASTPVTMPTDAIRARAYEIYERRGRQPGDAIDDWHRAEAELRAADDDPP